MNQAIQILDGFTFVAAKNALKIDVMAEGQMLVCFITGASEEALRLLYQSSQFEVEELIEQKVAQDQVNESGEIYLTFKEIKAF